jgi:putative SOS response-associated peptidase YedK
MPAILSPDALKEWLDPQTPVKRCLELLGPCEDGDFDYYEVSTFVNSPASDSPECIERIPIS